MLFWDGEACLPSWKQSLAAPMQTCRTPAYGPLFFFAVFAAYRIWIRSAHRTGDEQKNS